ncbi:MAG: DUF4292 domain-containing protein [Thermodesulfobacteriota bacterium]
MKNFFFFFLALFFPLASCVPPRLLPPEKPEPNFLLDQLRIRAHKISGLKGLAQVRITKQDKSLTSDHVLFLRRPAWLRAESLSPLGIPQLYLVTDGEEMKIYHPGENKYYWGPANSQHISNLLPISLSLADIVSLFLGSPPLIIHDTATVYKSKSEYLWILELQHSSPNRRQLLWIDPEDFLIHRVELYAAELIYQMTFAEYQQLHKVSFPHKIQYVSLNNRVQVEYKEIFLNPSWEKDDFHLPIPRGAKIIYWE